MKLSPRFVAQHDARFTLLKSPGVDAPEAQRDPRVAETVTAMLLDIEKNGIDAVRRYARELDRFEKDDFELSASDLASSGSRIAPELREAIDLGSARTKQFAALQREHLEDFEAEIAPGLVVGQKYVPVGNVGAYLPAGRFPLTASAFMTVGVAKVAGVPSVIGCTPPQPHGGVNDAVAYTAYVSGIDHLFVVGGVQALAAMAFGLLGQAPVDMIVGAGNAYVAEAKRQLFGTVAIDLLAGPSEVAVIADDTADPELVAADLLGQAEHGPNSPAALVTTSERLGRLVIAAVDRQLETLSTASICGSAWRDFGSVVLVENKEDAVLVMDELAPEHLEIQTADDAFYQDALTNYGSLFIGPWSTVAYSDKGMAGTNHTLPTAGGAKHSAGLSVSRYLKPLTFQKISREATPLLAPAVETISASEGMSAHEATATMRMQRYVG
ncbi:histidinol dehydrogenase [Leifsonia sp. F6_8S_P_1B]|uniref:Histidinol dehydrogenase n=1 Tax=Leifsonia williamsii TaxID=3035919 RepID=A0ABT8K8R6_9MICO|nr:histidinol dehydrogenase [Leifsonia williamsii]MDN4613856.1 histidinol dehydrogenase [Leifsonia williamsii]